MTLQEFSNEFDTLLNSYAYKAAGGDQDSLYSIELDEYEKSVFLTRALSEYVKALYQTDNTNVSFERNEKIRRQLEYLVKTKEYQTGSVEDTTKLEDPKYIHTVYLLPPKCWFIVYEQVKWNAGEDDCLSLFVVDVTPITHDDYWRVRNNPFRGPNDKRVLRLDNYDGCVELVSSNTIGLYTIRYIEKPTPIILEDLPDGLTIDEESEATECKLHSSIHQNILELAVQMAIQSRTSSTKDSKSAD